MKVLVTDKIHPDALTLLKSQAAVDEAYGMDEAQLTGKIPGYDALMVRSGTQVTAAVLSAGKNLKAVGRAGTGVDNINVPEATRLGIMVVNAPGANAQAAAEMAVALLLAAIRQLKPALETMKQNQWERTKFTGTEIAGKTVGLIGVGAVGKIVAKILNAFGAHVLAYDPFLAEEKAAAMHVTMASLEELYTQSDILSIHAPLNDSTRNLLDVHAFNQMKDGIMLVNAARGGIINEQALLNALNTGKVAAAGLDVFEKEPIPLESTSAKLVAHPRVVATPHLGASTQESQRNASVLAAQLLLDALNGQPVASVNQLPVVQRA
ncbi:hypothetical protein HY572_04965 [Candidatus Micrarchaeota archaeon]|nr:hypothetical protein [Candidatus Micrarchaeota archaeon]